MNEDNGKKEARQKKMRENNNESYDIAELALIALGSIALVASLIFFSLTYPKWSVVCYFFILLASYAL